MPKPWELNWDVGSDAAGLEMPPIVPFFGGQRPPMLGAGGPAIVPPTTNQYRMPEMDPAALQAAGSLTGFAADPTAAAGAGPSPALAADAFAASGMAPPQPLAANALAQQASFQPTEPLPDRFVQPTQPGPAASPPIPDPLAAAAGGQRLLQPASFDRWSEPAMQAGPLARPSQAGPDSPGSMPTQQQTILPNGVPDMIPPSMLHQATSPANARQPAHPEATISGNARNAPQPQQRQPVPGLIVPLPFSGHGMVNRLLWFDRIEHEGETSKQGQVSKKGAVSVMQIMPGTDRDAARLLNIPLDRGRLRKDATYARTLGYAYLDFLLKRYDGNVVLATAAYNGGIGNVRDWIKDLGDPRKGRISDAEFAQNIPFDQTRDYVGRVVYGETREEQEQRRQQEQKQKLEQLRQQQQTQSRRRPPPLLGRRR